MLNQYAILSVDGLSVATVQLMDETFISVLKIANPGVLVLPVNMIAYPAYNPLTQGVIQNGWTITDVDVQPVWVVYYLNAQAISDAITFLLTDIELYLSTWGSLSAGDKDTLLNRLASIIVLTFDRYKDAWNTLVPVIFLKSPGCLMRSVSTCDLVVENILSGVCTGFASIRCNLQPNMFLSGVCTVLSHCSATLQLYAIGGVCTVSANNSGSLVWYGTWDDSTVTWDSASAKWR